MKHPGKQLPHTLTTQQCIDQYHSSIHGMTQSEVEARIQKYGPNRFPEAQQPGVFIIFLRQFVSPLIYVLLAAAVLSIAIEEWSDAIFITAVLLINALIGTIQEYSAQRAASALSKLVTAQCQVLREGDTHLINAEHLVPGDILLFGSGDRIPADTRLLAAHGLEVDESLLTGESKAILKNPNTLSPEEASLGDRLNMAFAGSMVQRGRGRGIVVSTGLNTELGAIAQSVLNKPSAKAPLLIRMERFTHWVAILVAVAAIIMAIVAFYQGMHLSEIFLLAVALAVSAIPEGLPVALTVALAIGMRRMAKRNVIVRRLLAVESLGSCTFIATDKTGTLTINQLTVQRIVLPMQEMVEVTGSAIDPQGEIKFPTEPNSEQQALLNRLCLSSVLCNEASLGHKDGGWVHQGDAVDVAILVMAHKAGFNRNEALVEHEEKAILPFESEHMYSASLNRSGESWTAHVKGACEKVFSMCETMATQSGDVPITQDALMQQAHQLAQQGFRVLAIASGEVMLEENAEFQEHQLSGLTLLGLVGMMDPLREEAADAIQRCRQAGIEVAMVTGDHPATALSIARQLKLADSESKIVTGQQLKQAQSDLQIDALTAKGRVFARIEPQQKLQIVESLQRNGHFVAVSGDGANDAPALRAAHVGVAMGLSGTDVARETADLIITDDNFSSIVSGVEEGRIAYANVRNVIFLLISTGMAELVLFTLSLMAGMPLPLLAVQLLWLNLVTNGIQDVALAFEPARGNELSVPPRPPKDRIFNRIMIERVLLSAFLMGCVAFVVFSWMMNQGYTVEQARNETLLLMVLFENIHVFNSRSETLSAFSQNPLRNPVLLFGTLAAQGIHIAAMYVPWINDVLGIAPVSFEQWLHLLAIALSVLMIMELHKLVKKLLSPAE